MSDFVFKVNKKTHYLLCKAQKTDWFRTEPKKRQPDCGNYRKLWNSS